MTRLHFLGDTQKQFVRGDRISLQAMSQVQEGATDEEPLFPLKAHCWRAVFRSFGIDLPRGLPACGSSAVSAPVQTSAEGESETAVQTTESDTVPAKEPTQEPATSPKPSGRHLALGEDGIEEADAKAFSDAIGVTSRESAYRALCEEYLSMCGDPSMEAGSQGLAKGLALVRRLDMDGDGGDEIVLGYVYDKYPEKESYIPAVGIDVWSFREGRLAYDGQAPFSMWGTNGFFPYLQINARPQGGLVVVTNRCQGSAPITYSHHVFGYEDGTFAELAARYEEEGTPDWEYGVRSKGASGASEWVPVTQEEYDSYFDRYVGDQVLYAKLYSYPSIEKPDDEGDTLDVTLQKTREELESIGKAAK